MIINEEFQVRASHCADDISTLLYTSPVALIDVRAIPISQQHQILILATESKSSDVYNTPFTALQMEINHWVVVCGREFKVETPFTHE